MAGNVRRVSLNANNQPRPETLTMAAPWGVDRGASDTTQGQFLTTAATIGDNQFHEDVNYQSPDAGQLLPSAGNYRRVSLGGGPGGDRTRPETLSVEAPFGVDAVTYDANQERFHSTATDIGDRQYHEAVSYHSSKAGVQTDPRARTHIGPSHMHTYDDCPVLGPGRDQKSTKHHGRHTIAKMVAASEGMHHR